MWLAYVLLIVNCGVLALAGGLFYFAVCSLRQQQHQKRTAEGSPVEPPIPPTQRSPEPPSMIAEVDNTAALPELAPEPRPSCLEASTAKWLARAESKGSEHWSSKGGESESVHTSAGVKSQASKDSEAELLTVRNIPTLLRARTTETGLGGFELGAFLGRGSFGKVYKAKWRGTIVAVKIVEHDESSLSRMNALRESALCTSFQHPNVLITYKVLTQKAQRSSEAAVHGSKDSAMTRAGHNPSWIEKLLDAPPLLADKPPCTQTERVHEPVVRDATAATQQQPTPFASQPLPVYGDEATPLMSCSHAERCDNVEETRETWMLMEYCDRGSLRQALQAGRFRLRGDSSQQDVVTIFRTLIDIAAGMDFLHSVGVLHGDLKACNVLLKSTSKFDDPRGFVAKLADFGLSQVLDAEAAHVTTDNFGTVAYMPAELLRDGKMSLAVDCWSFGCLLWELWTGERMYQGLNPHQVFMRVMSGGRPATPDTMPQGYASLLEACWSPEPTNRPPFGDITRWLRALYYDNDGRDSRRSLELNPWD